MSLEEDGAFVKHEGQGRREADGWVGKASDRAISSLDAGRVPQAGQLRQREQVGAQQRKMGIR